GVTTIFVNATGKTSVPVPFTTCAVDRINLHLANSTDTAATITTGTAQALAFEVLDTRGATVNNAVLQFNGTQPVVASFAGGSASGGAPGTTSVVASCSPPDCNLGLRPVFSNMVSITVSGTLN